MTEPWRPDWTVHPGEILGEELETRGVSQAQLARETGVSPKHINEVIKGHSGIGVEFALTLGEYLGTSAELWLNLQQAYDLHHARKARQERRQS